MESVNKRPRPFVKPEQSKAKYKTTCALRVKCRRCKALVEKPHKKWGWYIGHDHFCSYRHMREWENEKKLKKLKGGKPYD